MEKEGLNLSEQMDFIEFYKDVQSEHNVTEKYFVDGYREEIENKLTDVNIKKKALEIVDQIESDLAENERMQDEEYAEQEKEGQEEPQFFFLDPADEEVEENEPLHVMTAAEKEAMNTLSMRESDFVSLEHIESSTLNTPNITALKATEGLNTAKEGLNTLKKGIANKIENVDAEKLDEQWQTFWLMAFSILKGFLSVATTVAIAFYKIPAKRHYKKKLDYTINETTGKDLKSMMEIQQNEMKHRFFVDWLPKLILFLSALLIYNEGWKIGLIALAIGFVYYMFTYLTFDYGGSRILNVLADNMYSQNIRLKDAYYNNILVMYQHLKEFQQAFGVTILENGKINLYFDPDLGWVLTFYIQEDKNVSFSSITDHKMNFYKILPAIDSYTNTAKLHAGRKVMMLLDQVLLESIGKAEILADLLAAKEEFIPCFPELKHIAEAKRQEEEARLSKEADDKFYADIANKKLSERAVNIVKFLRKESDILGMSPHDLNNIGIKGNEDYLKVRMHLNQGTTPAQAQAKLAYIGSKTGVTPKLRDAATDSAVNLMFFLNKSLKSRAMTMNEIKEEGRKGIFTLGKGYLGDYVTKIPRQDQPFFVLVGGLSRSGKSTLATRLLVNTTYLQDENGFYDYQDYFISSVKDEDYQANGFQQSGMFVTGSPLETYNMLCLVDDVASKRKETFLKHNLINIKQYNKKFPNDKMGKIMVVMDEYANLFRACGSLKIEVNSSKIKLKDAIEEKLVKINAEQGSRGVSSIIITQNFKRDEVGEVRETIQDLILGNAAGNVWSSYDNTGQISKTLESKKDEKQGVFLMNSSAFQPLKGVETDVVQGFVETKTHFIDTEDILAGFDRTYDTAAKYSNIIKNVDFETEGELVDLNDDVEETPLETNITNDVVDEIDEDEVRF